MVGEMPNTWYQWLSLAEFWYNTSHHSAIQMSPLQALYGFPPPIHIPYFPKDSNVAAVDLYMRDREAAIALLKHHLTK